MTKVVMITGGSRGIGLATALVMGRQGWAVAVTGTNEAALAEAAALLEQNQVSHCALPFHVEDEAAWEPAVSTIESRLGRISALVCNAGISPKVDGKKIPFEKAGLEVWRRTMAVNVDGVLLGFRALTPRFMAGGGSMVAVSSLVGRMALPLGSAYYTTSKTAVIGLVRAAAVDLGPYGIRVNAVLPGRIETDMTKEAGAAFNQSLVPQIALRRLGRPDEVASGIAFLCSDAASYITGVSLDIGGGWCVA